MKNNIANNKWMKAAAACWLCVASTALAVVNYSPVGPVWDCTISGGGQQGLAVISFSDDGTFSGYQILSAKPRKASDNTYGRTPTEDTGRGNASRTATPSETGGSTSTIVVRTNLAGFFRIEGPWRHDQKGRVTGFFKVRVQGQSDTDTAETQGVSFVAKVIPEKRISIVASTPNGGISYSGVASKELPDFSGAWYATKVKNKQKLGEFFTLSQFVTDNPIADEFPDLSIFPNVYFTTDGTGPGYNFTGVGIFSSRKQVAMFFRSLPDDAVIDETNPVPPTYTKSAVFGGYAVRKTYSKVSATGVEGSSIPLSYTAILTAQ